MKLHLPKLLRVAVMTSLLCSIAPVAYAEITYPDVKEVTIDGKTYTYTNVGQATSSNAFNGYAYNNDLVVEDGDLVGYFDETAWESTDSSVVKSGFKNTAFGNGSLNPPVASSLYLGAAIDTAMQPNLANAKNITINGSGQVYLGGKSGSNYHSGFIAKDVTISAGATGTITDWNNPDSCKSANLRADAARMSTLTINGGAAILGTFSTGGGNSTSGATANTFMGGMKSVTITDGLYVNGGSLRLGRADSGTGGTNRKSLSNYFKTTIKGNFEQTGGALQVWGKTYLDVNTVKQTGGSMNLAKDKSGAVDYLIVAKSELTLHQNDDDCVEGATSSMSVDGIISGTSASRALKLNVLQEGKGTISINKGVAFKTSGTNYSTITQTGGGAVKLTGDFTSATFNVDLTNGTLVLTSASTKLKSNEVTLASGVQLDNNGIFTVGTGAAGAAGVLNVTTGGTLNLVLDGKNTAINVGAASADTNTVTGWTMATGSTLGIGFTSDYLGTLTTTEKEGVKTYDFTTAGVLVATDTNDSVDVTSFECTLTGLDDRYWEWSDDAALSEDAQGNITLSGSLSFNPWVEVDEDNDHLDYVDDTAGGETGIIIKENVTLEGDNNHSLGTKIVGAEVELGHEDALGQSEIVTTSGTSQLSTADGVTANLSSEITVEGGDLTIKGSYKAAAGVLDEGLSQDAAYFCVDGNEGDNGFYRSATVEAHKVVEVEQGATLNVDALDNVLVTVDGEEYQLYDDGLAGAKLDYSEYHMNTEAHDVAASEILAAGTADTKVLMGSDAGTLTADTAIEVDAEGGIVQTTAAAEVSGSLDGVAIVAEGGEISATIGDDSSVLAQAGKTTITGANSYTGGTVIDNAELVVGHQEALGDGSIVLQNQGILDMGGYAVSNDLLVTGCTIKGAGAYTGNMTIQNPTQLDDATTATSVKLEKAGGFTGPGSLTTGSLEVATDTDASIEGSLTINDNGTVTLNDGKVLGVNGSLTLAGATTLTLNGDYAVGDKLLTGNDSLEEGAITLVYNDSTVELERIGNSIVLVSKFKQDKADMAAQSNWGIATASRAFVNTVRGQHSHTGCIGNGRGTVWAAVLGAYNDMDGADISVQGAAVGVDAKVGSRSTVGIAAGYTDGEVSPAGLRDVDQEGNYVALYGEHGLKKLGSNSCLSLDWVAAYGQTESKANGLKWEQDSLQLNTRLNWNKKMTDRLCMSVFGGLEYFATGSDTSEGVKSGSIQNLRGEIGVGARYVAWGAPGAAASYDEKGAMVTASRPGCEKLVLNGEIRYFNDMVRSNPVIEMDGLRGDGENPGRYGMGIEAGATYRIGERWSASANYSFNAMEDSTEHRVNVGASYTF